MDTNFAGMNKSFCRNASGAILVGDITDIDSIEATAKWKEEVENIVSLSDSPIPMVLALNKYDLLTDKAYIYNVAVTTTISAEDVTLIGVLTAAVADTVFTTANSTFTS